MVIFPLTRYLSCADVEALCNIICLCRWFSFYSNLFSTTVTIVLLTTWFMPKLWETSVAVAVHFGYSRSHEVLITIVYNLLDAGKDILLAVPFSLYSTFVVEQRHGFNKQTLAIFIKDQVIGVSWPDYGFSNCLQLHSKVKAMTARVTSQAYLSVLLLLSLFVVVVTTLGVLMISAHI